MTMQHNSPQGKRISTRKNNRKWKLQAMWYWKRGNVKGKKCIEWCLRKKNVNHIFLTLLYFVYSHAQTFHHIHVSRAPRKKQVFSAQHIDFKYHSALLISISVMKNTTIIFKCMRSTGKVTLKLWKKTKRNQFCFGGNWYDRRLCRRKEIKEEWS